MEPLAEAELQVALSRTYMRLGRNEQALTRAERALTIAEPNGYERVVADALNARAAVISRSGRRREAMALQRAAVSLAAANGWADLEIRLRNNLAVLLQEDDFRAAIEESRRMVQIAERIGSARWYLRAVATLADSLLEMADDWDEVEAIVEDALARAGDDVIEVLVAVDVALRSARGEGTAELMERTSLLSQNPHHASICEAVRARVQRAAGDMTKAEMHARRALELDETGEGAVMYADSLIGVLLPARDLPKLRELQAFVRGIAHAGDLSHASADLIEGAIATLEDRVSDGRALLQRAIDRYRDMGLGWTAAQYELASAQLAPHIPEAAAWLADARETFSRVRATAYLRELDLAEAAVAGANVAEKSTTTASSPAATG
jgi:tetratricopeptide (TPR) repeat protein